MFSSEEFIRQKLKNKLLVRQKAAIKSLTWHTGTDRTNMIVKLSHSFRFETADFGEIIANSS